ncbi:hypothetical protein E4U21_000246 [Claviceps maximensis]|nr:hypothetical protein E4U21_000246 [Claviceps maximensis]
MSSPDPLNDLTMADLASQPPSSATRRITRSQSSQRFVSLALGDSPQRSMFVPSQLDGDNNPVGSSARRKLFQSPYPNSPSSPTPARQLRRQTTTTTVPLRESIERGPDDGTTPKQRGRPRKANGTPMPGAGTKRRAGTPVKRTPRRARTMASREQEEASFQPSLQTTPTPKRNVRARKTPGATVSTLAKLDITPRVSTARRGRRRRQALAPDELLELADEVGDINLDTTQLPPVTSDDEVDLVRAPSESPDDAPSTDEPRLPPISGPATTAPSSPSPATGVAAEPASDSWVTSMPYEPTPKAVQAVPRTQDNIPEFSSRFGATHILPQYAGQQDDEASQAGDYDDGDDSDNDYGYGDMGAGGSDHSSIDEPLREDEPPTTMAPSAYDTIAQGEDFSMIFMESIQSLHPNFDSSVHSTGAHDELGEETSLIINKTLESLRQGAEGDDPKDEVDAVHLRDAFADAQHGERNVEDEERKDHEQKLPDMPTEQLPPPPDGDLAPAQQQSSSPNSRPNPYLYRSPRKSANPSPLRHRVLKYSAMQAGGPIWITETAQTAGFPQPSQSHQHAQNAEYPEEQLANSYEDSFSEIPEAVLTAATPRRPLVDTSYPVLEDEVGHAQVEEAQSQRKEGSAMEEEIEEAEEIARQEHVRSEQMHQDDADTLYHGLTRVAAQIMLEGQNEQKQQQENSLSAIERQGLDAVNTVVISGEQPTRNLESVGIYEDGKLFEDEEEKEEAHQVAELQHRSQSEPSLFVDDNEEASQVEPMAFQDEMKGRTEPEREYLAEPALEIADGKDEDEAHGHPADYEVREDTLGASTAGPFENSEEGAPERSARGEYDDEQGRQGEQEEGEEEEEMEDVEGLEEYGVQGQYNNQRQQQQQDEQQQEREGEGEDEMEDVEGLEEYGVQGQYNNQRQQQQQDEQQQERGGEQGEGEEEMEDVEGLEEYGVQERYDHQRRQQQQQQLERDEDMEDAGEDMAGYGAQERYDNQKEQLQELPQEADMEDADEFANARQDMTRHSIRERYEYQQQQQQQEQAQKQNMEDAKEMEYVEEDVAQHSFHDGDVEREMEQHDEEMTTNVGNAKVIYNHTTQQIVPVAGIEVQAQYEGGNVYDDDDPVDKEMAEAMEAAIQAEEQRAIVASSTTSTTATSDQARLSTPDETPPQADLEATDASAYKSHVSPRPSSIMRFSPRSPGRFSFDAGFAAEHTAPARATTQSPSRFASSPRYPGRVGDAASAVVIQRREEIKNRETADDHVETGQVEDVDMKDYVGSEEEEEAVEQEEVEEGNIGDVVGEREEAAEEEEQVEEDKEDKEEEDREEAGIYGDLVEQEPAAEPAAEPESEPALETELEPEPESQPGPQQQHSAPVEMSRPSFDLTPPHQVSSPLQEPQSLQQDTSQTKTARPHLTAIVRAGQVLQTITSDPPSPEGRDKQLGSPFRRSASKDSWNGSRDSQSSSHRLSRSPRLPRIAATTAATTAARWDGLSQQKVSTPTTATTTAVQGVVAQPVQRSAESPIDRAGSPSHESLASSMRVTPPSEGAMSWVAREGPISPRLRGDNSLRAAAGLPEHETFQVTPRAQESVQKPSQEAILKNQGTNKAVVEEIRDDETDIWELEAQRETPLPARQRQRQLQQSFGKRDPTRAQRRSGIPSPWTKKSIHRPTVSRMISQSVPDLSHVSEEPSVLPDDQAAAAAATTQSSEPDEYSLLAQRQQEEEEANRAAQAPVSVVKEKKRFDLLSFFSSPATIPGMLSQQPMLTKTRQPALLTSNAAGATMSMAAEAPRVVPTSSMFPQVVPPKEVCDDDDDGRGGDDSSSSASLSSVRMRPAAGSAWRAPIQQQEVVDEGEEHEQEEQEEQEEKEEEDEEDEEEELQLQQSSPEVDERSSSPATPEILSMPTVAQKQNFTPRPRQASHSFFQPSSNRSVAVTPPRMQLSRADIQRWNQQTSDTSESSSDFRQPPPPFLRPLPPKNASPTKSALRSPMKPHTPGRVVDFTSSVLSPAEQARVRHDRQSSSHSLFSPQQQEQQERRRQQQPVPFRLPFPDQHDRQSSHSSTHDISMGDAPPLPKQAPVHALSQTTWSRRHWLLLDHFLQLRRQQPFSAPYTRHADRFLGKTVKSHGKSMTLQRWHLDCVDAFKAKVGGWDEAVLAKRLFALILGEQKRKKNKAIMFH